MATIVDCPSCSRKLRVPEELLGKKVKCPTCSGTFDAVAAPDLGGTPMPSSPVRPPVNPQLELGNESRIPPGSGERSPAPAAPSETPPGSLPVSEQETLMHPGSEPAAEQDLVSCPYCGEKIGKEATRCQFCGEELDEEDRGNDRPWDQDYRPYRDVRRDSEPHRGTLILTLGISSIVVSVLSTCSYGLAGIVGLILGICVWVMGQKDLKKMRSNQMDPQGLGSTQAGWICGIIGTIFGGLGVLLCGVMMVFFIYMMQMSTKMTPTPTPAPPGPVVRPAPAPAQKNAPMRKNAPAQKKVEEKKAPAPDAPAPPVKKDE